MTSKKKLNKVKYKKNIQKKKQTNIVKSITPLDIKKINKLHEVKEKGSHKIIFRKHLLIPFFFFAGLWILIICGYKVEYKNNNQFNLQRINIIDKDELNTVIQFTKMTNYNSNNLTKYLDYFDKYDIPMEYIIIIVNNNLENIEYNDSMKDIIEHNDFIEINLSRYLDYLDKYQLSVDKTILAVNNGLDKYDIKLDNNVEKFIKQKYFISDNINRYLDYQQKHSNLSFKEIITRINSNLDQTFYQDVSSADTSKGILILVNKFYYLESDYVPSNLVSISSKYGTGKLNEEAYTAFKLMYNDAAKEGLYLYISSPYRSFNRQETLYNKYVNLDGITKADRYSARPGYSEHQTGLAFDLGTVNNHNINEFAESGEFKWVQENAHKYGFIMRYPYNKTYITGYIYEPWHYRYVGIEAATYIYENNITYEEYYAYYVK